MVERNVREASALHEKMLEEIPEVSNLLAEVEVVLKSSSLTCVYKDDVQQPLMPSHLFTSHGTIIANEIIEDNNEICDLTREGSIDQLNAVDMVLSYFWKR